MWILLFLAAAARDSNPAQTLLILTLPKIRMKTHFKLRGIIDQVQTFYNS